LFGVSAVRAGAVSKVLNLVIAEVISRMRNIDRGGGS
jgi:hypothetical protein